MIRYKTIQIHQKCNSNSNHKSEVDKEEYVNIDKWNENELLKHEYKFGKERLKKWNMNKVIHL